MKTQKKNLFLKKETVSVLNRDEALLVKGGNSWLMYSKVALAEGARCQQRPNYATIASCNIP